MIGKCRWECSYKDQNGYCSIPDRCVRSSKGVSVLYETRVPKASVNRRLTKEIAGKSPEETYDFLNWLINIYGMQFTDSRGAVIEWLKGEEQ